MSSPYTILLYYKYVHVADPQQFMLDHRVLCERLGLKGRIIVAEEGLNGTVEGTTEATSEYMQVMHADPRFADMVFKLSEGTGCAFPKLSIKARQEIVSAHLGDEDVNPNQITGKRLDPDVLDQWYDEGRDFVVVDMRNDYELDVGYFEGTVMPGLKNFRDLPQVIEKIKPFKDKTVVTVCTGGVRCEKASGYLVSKGFSDVYQLEGGMATYMAQHPGKHFKGKLYVFDGRVVMGDGVEDPSRVVGKCRRCNGACEQYVNCKNQDCNLHFICCDTCRGDNKKWFCSDLCEATGRVAACIE